MNNTNISAGKQLANMIVASIAEQATLGYDWPNDAVMCATYKMHTWPCGWDKETSVAFFTSGAEFKEFLEHKLDWAQCEDNDFALQVYFWDWGPQHIAQYDRNSHLL